MKIAKFKVISVVTMIIMILIIPTLIGIKATNTNKIINKYIVLGDDVSFESENCYEVSYVTLIKDFFKAINSNLNYRNLSEKSMTSSDLLNLINLKKNEINNADLIVVSIGVNNVLNTVIQKLCNELDLNIESLKNYDETTFDLIIGKYLNGEEINLEVAKEIKKFEKDFPNIIDNIKNLSPNSEIYLNTVYNPINKKGSIYEYFNERIKSINEVITKYYNKYNYKVIDCYNILNSDEKLNFQIENNQFKIYSSKAGHAMMATQVISDYEDYASLKVNKITTSSDNIKGKTVPNSNIIVVSQKGTVGTAQADKNGKFEVKIPPMISGTSLEILVYDDNIFSILYKFQKVMVRKSLFTS